MPCPMEAAKEGSSKAAGKEHVRKKATPTSAIAQNSRGCSLRERRRHHKSCVLAPVADGRVNAGSWLMDTRCRCDVTSRGAIVIFDRKGNSPSEPLTGTCCATNSLPNTLDHRLGKKSLLIVYVDDFKLAATAELHDKLLKGIKSVIDMDDEIADGRFLGCVQHTTTASTNA